MNTLNYVSKFMLSCILHTHNFVPSYTVLVMCKCYTAQHRFNSSTQNARYQSKKATSINAAINI